MELPSKREIRLLSERMSDMVLPSPESGGPGKKTKRLRRRLERHESQRTIAQALGRTFAAVGSRAQLLGLRMTAPLRPRPSE